MKRLLVVLVLALIATAVAAAPAYAYRDPQGAGYAASAAQTVVASHASNAGVATTQGRTVHTFVIHSRGMVYSVASATHGGATAAAVAALLALVAGIACFAILADRRRPVPAQSGSESARYPSYKSAADRGRKAA
jgi:hypothetical protein